MPAQSIKKLDWLAVLNAQADWRRAEDIQTWLAALVGHETRLSPQAMQSLMGTLDFLREQLTAMHFGSQLEIDTLNKKLAGIKIEIDAAGASGLSALPSLRAHRENASDDALVQSIERTVLIGFAFLAGEYVDDPASSPVGRCNGLYKDSDTQSLSPAHSFSRELELKWRKEIPELDEFGLTTDADVKRCFDFFPARAKTRFCSDDCRYRTFQLTKQLRDPGYLAEKQRRYRSRKGQP